ncbi:hypothetical protein K491DRAFT_389985 [Lophiostoma macrostomum CBS 122681]|uniref:Uncharacterized protein n=1 Tax=Lophiostoma macrostomum CBS 122681 TaxID=1314788 RepID=A0A6A6T8R5_9PLEO|nr:hypothetical protein K491DRAFT_389985 [Lophiostoma macrostomum CBS 122681]
MAKNIYKRLVQYVDEVGEDNDVDGNAIMKTILEVIGNFRRESGAQRERNTNWEEDGMASKSAGDTDQENTSEVEQLSGSNADSKAHIRCRSQQSSSKGKEPVRMGSYSDDDRAPGDSTRYQEQRSNSKGRQTTRSNHMLGRHDSMHGTGCQPRGTLFDVSELDEWSFFVHRLDAREDAAARGESFGPFCKRSSCICEGILCRTGSELSDTGYES